MSRKIMIAEVTAMAFTSVCVAGIDEKNRHIVRLAEPSPNRHLVQLLHLVPGALIDADVTVMRKPEHPHVEDAYWHPRRLKHLRDCTFDEMTIALSRDSFAGPHDAFGSPQFASASGNAGWLPTAGDRSLATIRATNVHITTSDGAPRLTFIDGNGTTWTSVPFQDLSAKIHSETCPDCRSKQTFIEMLRRDFDSAECLVRIGLTRPYASGDGPLACWLQVTNVLARAREHF